MSKPVTVVETHVFERFAEDCLSDDERVSFIDFIAFNPSAGAVIQGTGGVRKVRWGVDGRGKSGGVRVIYYFMDGDNPLYLLTIYAKSQQDNISAEMKRKLKQLTAELKKAAKQGANQ